LELTVNNSNKLDYTVVYNDDSAVITIGAPTTDSKYSTYITGIRIVDKVPKTVVEATESTAAYVTYGDKDYAIIVVPASKAADDNNTKITLTFNSEDTAGPTEVYKNVQFGNKTYGADSFGGTSDDYVYGYAVTAADGSTAQAGIAAMTVTIE
jgi:uncharacterized lipoprotein NlpE involved in copper resistance